MECVGDVGSANSKMSFCTVNNDDVLGLAPPFETVLETVTVPAWPDPSSVQEECWAVAEEEAQNVVYCIHPTLDSDERRRDVIDYVQRLIKSHLDCEVFPYGSVPLKTYLPDGDIDLTALGSLNGEEFLATNVLAVLLAEEQNADAEYEVRDTQFIDAEVKLVKCLVQNIVVDISVNQLGGLCTLCFLERVDRRVGKNHLFKRSIILVKTWCYYESRILGAHHGLISTYALETLVLYIFHLFHSSLTGPLAVLYRFLDYYSQFDWDNYCVSLNGPVHKALLPDIVAQMPEDRRDKLMFSEEFLRNSMEMFSAPPRCSETNTKAFQTKHLNIFDPLKENNNLGRSVHRGNFFRIRSAFKYGARKLGRVLSLPKDRIGDGIRAFFSNTLARHGSKYGCGRQHPAVFFDDEDSVISSVSFHSEVLSEDDIFLKSPASDFENDSLGLEEKYTSAFGNDLARQLTKEVSVDVASETHLSDDLPAGDSDGLATSNSNLRSGNGTSTCTLSGIYSGSGSLNCNQRSSQYSSKSSRDDGNQETRNFDQADLVSGGGGGNFRSNSLVENCKNFVQMDNIYQWCISNLEFVYPTGSTTSTPKVGILGSLCVDLNELELDGTGEETEENPLLDLTGDYDCHIRNLLDGQCCHGLALCTSVLSNHQSPASKSEDKKPWDTFDEYIPLVQTEFSQMNNDITPAVPPMHCAASSYLPAGFGYEENQKARGTGTYIPKPNGYYWERLPQWWGRYNATSTQTYVPICNHGNDANPLWEKRSFEDGTTNEVLYDQFTIENQEISGLCHQSSSSPMVEKDNHIKSSSGSTKIQFGSVGNLGEEAVSGLSQSLSSTRGVSLCLKDSKAAVDTQQERFAGKCLHLKNEQEFPPLCL